MKTDTDVESVTQIDSSKPELASWNQPRSTNQLLGFIARREAAIADLADSNDD